MLCLSVLKARAETVSLGLVVSKATHGLKNVQWEAPSLLAAAEKLRGRAISGK
ncbi:hypothetical protein ACNKHM_05895 [Shigella sonnei]